jgi:hypothetical protein
MVRAGRFTDSEVSEVAEMAHNMAGTAAMFGEAELGDAAAALDAGISLWPQEERAERIRGSFEAMYQIARRSA